MVSHKKNSEVNSSISHNESFTRFLVACGIFSSLYYVAINIFVPMWYEGYSYSDLTVSELSAIDAPTRALWVLLAIGYIVLFAGFGWGVIRSSSLNKRLRFIGILILIYAVINVYWPPMHQRGTETSLTDALHIVWSALTVFLMMVIMVFSARALSKPFQVYTMLTIIAMTVFAVLTSRLAPNIPLNEPTPMLGTWERILIGLFMVWVIVLSLVLLKAQQRSK